MRETESVGTGGERDAVGASVDSVKRTGRKEVYISKTIFLF